MLIVGAGVIGLSTAWHIKNNNPSLSVLVIDHNAAPAQGETAKSVAAVRDCFTSEVNRLLSKSTIEFYKHMQSSQGFNLNLELVGYLWLFTESQFSNFEPIEKQMGEQGVRFRIWERRDLANLIPDLVLDPGSEQSKIIGMESIYKGAQALNCGTVSAELVATFFESEFQKLGGKFQFGTEVKSLRLDAKNRLNLPGEPYIWQEKVFAGVETNRGKISADNIVIAAGVRTPLLLDPVGIDCLVKAKKRQVFQFRGGKPLLRLLATEGFNEQNTIPFTILPRAGIHFRPVPREESFWVAASDHIGRQFLLEEEPMAEESYYMNNIYPILSEYFPCFRDLRPANSWAGHYDINSFDGAPIVEKVSNCIFVAGMSGSGIMKADAIGRVATAVFEGKDEARLFGGTRILSSRLGLTKRAVEKEKFVL